jgi:hypothetical protein
VVERDADGVGHGGVDGAVLGAQHRARVQRRLTTRPDCRRGAAGRHTDKG